jgi:hypothetical protein
MGTVRRRLGNERGSVAAIMAVVLMVMLALSALAIDLAATRDAKAESQRAADVIALAGASAFRDMPWADGKTADSALRRAKDVARDNKVWNDTLYIASVSGYPKQTTPAWATQPLKVDSMRDVTIVAIPDSQKVRVWVRRAGIRTFFGKLLARPFVHVQSMATAWATNAGPTVNCLKPFFIPDMWHEANKSVQDKNNNDYMEPEATPQGEQWFYEPSAGDYYAPYDPSVTNPPRPQTGYGSEQRTSVGYPGDVGLPMLLKPQTGNNQRQGNWYYTLDGPENNLRSDIENGCITANVGDTADLAKGGKTGQARQGIQTLIGRDPSATWDQASHSVKNSAYNDWTQSPRVIIVALMDPIFITGNNVNQKPNPNSTFSNFVRVFLQDTPGNTDNIQAIFVGPAPGGHGGPTGGTLVKQLQLIQ